MFIEIVTHQHLHNVGDPDIEEDFSHFIDLSKDELEKDVISFVNHLNYFKGQKVIRVRFVSKRLGAW